MYVAFEDLECLTGLLDMAEKFWLKLHYHEMHHNDRSGRAVIGSLTFQGFSRVFCFDTNSESHAAVKAWLAITVTDRHTGIRSNPAVPGAIRVLPY